MAPRVYLALARRDKYKPGSGKVEGGSKDGPGAEPIERVRQGLGLHRCLRRVHLGRDSCRVPPPTGLPLRPTTNRLLPDIVKIQNWEALSRGELLGCGQRPTSSTVVLSAGGGHGHRLAGLHGVHAPHTDLPKAEGMVAGAGLGREREVR